MARSPSPMPVAQAGRQGELFGAPAALPAGLVYQPDFLTAAQEADLLRILAELPLAPARYKGYTARRRVLSFGSRYDFDDNRLQPGLPLPDSLLPLRAQVAAWRRVAPEDFTNVLVASYAPGTPLGWHRDVPDFEMVVGVSLGGWCEMRLRRYPPAEPRHRDSWTLELAPRSAYVLEGEARWGWQHSVAPTPALRYSVTFRTAAAGRRRPPA
ncbi:alpha-ketoglutarate-dependent dioxygenase AlkB [Aquabacterium sp. A7-Y]|uniref:alpha-ketoglutarate-dependent dioxygenase AlkB n=1 Tax=Aquabacterium sp. A7-Y TaxID=1349605 RepID=UPI00223DBDD4|nr:alpha-ketoglutarate-dependent dioxygenase AlkB [Aquabacterium sp. A7-Y]MCW7538467.1 alpha-ketoglutarate-dependent dioxygenase AlkB [Aquabacterium sp. A7-Y]